MSTRAKLEACLATADADWRRANEDLEKAQAVRARANAQWDSLVTERREPEADRHNHCDDIASFAKVVADRHEAYINQIKAETDRDAAMAKLNTATAERNMALAALDLLNRAEESLGTRIAADRPTWPGQSIFHPRPRST